MSVAGLRVRDLKVHFRTRRRRPPVRAVDGVDLFVPAGRTVGLIGESGSGKTTVGRAILGLNRPAAGVVEIDDGNRSVPLTAAMRPKTVQTIFQDPDSSLDPRMTVWASLREPLEAQRLMNSAAEDRLLELALRAGVAEQHLGRYPHQLSGGQKQRICIARALALRPDYVVCDEPTSALDVSLQADILRLLRDLRDDYGIALLFISHDLGTVGAVADRIAVMYLGRIVEEGTAREILESPRHPYTQALLDAHPAPSVGERHRSRIVLEGEIPDPASPPPGCHFAPRCPLREPRCEQRYPDLLRDGNGRKVACHVVNSPSPDASAAPTDQTDHTDPNDRRPANTK